MAEVDVREKTYAFLRMTLVALLLALGVAVIWQTYRQGWQTLDSVSAYYYTPAQPIFVGALIGLGACMIALRGGTRPFGEADERRQRVEELEVRLLWPHRNARDELERQVATLEVHGWRTEACLRQVSRALQLAVPILAQAGEPKQVRRPSIVRRGRQELADRDGDGKLKSDYSGPENVYIQFEGSVTPTRGAGTPPLATVS